MTTAERSSRDPEAAVLAVQAGDAEAYGQVVRACAPYVRAWTALRAPPGIDPDDVAHQAFIAAFARIDDYRPGAGLRPWLTGFARNILRNECRAARRRLTHTKHYAQVAWMEAHERQLAERADEDGPERRLQAMRGCLGELRDEARDLLALRYDEDLPIATIADRQGRSPGAIAKSLCMLRRRLHDCIRNRLGEGLT